MADDDFEGLRVEVARLRVREAELTALYETAQDLASIRDLDHVLAAIVRRARTLLHADMTYLSLTDEDEGASYMKVAEGALTPEFAKLRLPLGTGLMGLVSQIGAPYFTEDYQSDQRFVHRNYIDAAVAGEQIRAILGVPLFVDGRVIGALLAVHRRVRPFPPDEVALLVSLAGHAALAIENARLFEQARGAIVDAAEANQLLRARTASVERAAHVHDRLNEVLVRRGGVADIATLLGESLGAEVAVHDEQLRPLTEPLSLPQRLDLPGAVERALASGQAVDLAPGWWVVTANGGDEQLGSLVVHRAAALDQAEIRTIERAAIVTALVLLFDRTATDAEERLRGELLGELLADAIIDERRLVDRLRHSGASLAEPLTVVVADVAEAERTRAARAASRLAREADGLGGEHQGRIVVVLPTGEGGPRAVGDALRSHLGGPGVTAGVASSEPSLGGMRAGYREARRCLDALLALGRTGEVADSAGLGLARLLLGENGPEALEDFLNETLGPVLEWDRRRGAMLGDTLAAWFAAAGSLRSAAKALHVHPNTVAQRLERVSALLGEGWRDGERALDLHLALRLRSLRDVST